MWLKREEYFELNAEQRSPEWHLARQCMITGSILEAVLGWCRFNSREKVLLDILGLSEPKEVNENMMRGIVGEDPLRTQFMEEILPEWSYSEPSLCFGTTVYDFPLPSGRLLSEEYGTMKENPFHPAWFIGASPDGLAEFQNTKIVLECKCPEYLYPPLLHNEEVSYWVSHSYPHLLNEKEREEAKENYSAEDEICVVNKIKLAHLLQMYGQMAATRRKYAYYLVGYEKPQPGYYYQLVPFDQEFWQRYAFPGIVYFILHYLLPSMTEEQKENHRKKVMILQKDMEENLVPYLY